jgi:hypothetical protein
MEMLQEGRLSDWALPCSHHMYASSLTSRTLVKMWNKAPDIESTCRTQTRLEMQSRVIRGYLHAIRPSKRHYERTQLIPDTARIPVQESIKKSKQQTLDEESLHPYVMLSDLKLFPLFRQGMKALSFLSVGLTP